MMNPTEAIMIVLTTGLVLLCFSGLAIADYIVTALGVSGVARAKGISNDWLAWLPIGQDWVLGSTVEKIDEKRGIKRAWAIILTILSAVFWVLFCLYIGLLIQMINHSYMLVNDTMLMNSMTQLYAIVIPFSIVSTVWATLQYVCRYKIFEDIVPHKSLKYFVLGILLPLAYGILMLKCKKVLEPEIVHFDAVIAPAAEPAEECTCEACTCEAPEEESPCEETKEEIEE